MCGYNRHSCVYYRPIVESQVRRVLADDLSGKRFDSPNVAAGEQKSAENGAK